MRIALGLACVLLLLASCASEPKMARAPLIPVPSGPIDPPDAVLRAGVADFLSQSQAPAASGYEFSRVDLDADGRRDALVLFNAPYGYWCDRNGCTMLVLKAGDDRFTLVNAIQPIRAPLYISDSQSNGWKDLIVRVSGRWDPAKDVEMAFNGHEYPSNPDELPPSYPLAQGGPYVRLFQ
jgi:hypothetical protein